MKIAAVYTALRSSVGEQLREAIVAGGDELVIVDREGQPTEGGDLADAGVFLRWWSKREVSEAVVQAAAKLRWMHTPSAGLDQVLFPALVESDIVLTNSSGVHAIPISEWVLLYTLAAAKRLPELLTAQHERKWLNNFPLQELSDKTMLVVGYGAIGREVAKRAAPFMHVIAARSGSKGKDEDTPAGVEVIYSTDAWKAALPTADFVTCCLPLTDDTHSIFGEAEFAAMKPSAWFINIARGPLADEDALLHALQEGQIAGAGLDAFGEEPLPSDHPLYNLPATKVILTPHISWSSPQIEQRALALFLDNLRRFKAGEPLRNVVDKQKGY